MAHSFLDVQAKAFLERLSHGRMLAVLLTALSKIDFNVGAARMTAVTLCGDLPV